MNPSIIRPRLHFKLMSTLILGLSLLQGGCMQQKKQDPYKEGDIVTWLLWGEMIIKAEIGERRTHSLENHSKRGESEFYRPHAEHYLGQFPIDYQPKAFATISEEEALAMPVKPIMPGQALEFNLMLNGSWAQASDRSVISDEALDHPDQVKVVINPNHSTRTTKEAHLMYVKGKYEKEMSEKYKLQCRTRDDIGLVCFSSSTNSPVSGIVFSFRGDDQVKAISYEPIYGGIKVEWYFHRNNLQHWQTIDTAIWDLIDTWNISPIE